MQALWYKGIDNASTSMTIIPTSPTYSSPLIMCKWRQVQHFYAVCKHAYNLPDELIQCEDRYCKFSSTHPGGAVDCGPKCRNTCWQYRQFPQQYNRTFQQMCQKCLQGQSGRGQSR
ncbi:hypothetical protein E4T56_gene3029 [Termitomyces sp. T112]|nr:hypothetical protein E4T56_gene3029 [Termitomyces sp. T112]